MKTKIRFIVMLTIMLVAVVGTYAFKPAHLRVSHHHTSTQLVTDDCPCSSCNQTGSCGYCGGKGQYRCAVCNGTGSSGVDNDGNRITCYSCNGAGNKSCGACSGNGRCSGCNGRGRIPCH